MKPIAFGVIHLTPQLPWITKAQSDAVKKQFKLLTYEELKLETEKRSAVMPSKEEAAKTEEKADKGKNKGQKLWKKLNQGAFGNGNMSVLESRLCHATGWNYETIEQSNHHVIDEKELLNATEEDQNKYTSSLNRIMGERKAAKKAQKKAE